MIGLSILFAFGFFLSGSIDCLIASMLFIVAGILLKRQ